MVTTTLNESVYDLLPNHDFTETKSLGSKFYTSKFKEQVKYELKASKVGTHRTFGEAKVTLPHSADSFLKKDTNTRQQPTVTAQCRVPDKKFEYDCHYKRPAVPAINDNPIMGLRTQKNFVHDNAIETIMSVAKKPTKIYVDTIHGDKHALEPSGLEPVYLGKKDFGKTPDYLASRKVEMEKAKEQYEQYVQERMRQGALERLSNEDRRLILRGLKANWERIHHEFQNLSVMVDTIPKKQRKERMENEMKQLEKDIDLLERYQFIYIAN